MQKNTRLNALAASAFALGLGSVDASALLINADYQGKNFGIPGGNFNGQGALPDPGNDVWNSVNFVGQGNATAPTAVTGNLLASDGTATGVTLTLVNPFHFNAEAFGPNPNYATGYNALLGDFVDGGGSGGAVQIDGLDASTLYTLAFYNGNANGGVAIELDGVTQFANTAGQPHPLTVGVDYVLFPSVVPDASGSIDFTYFGQHSGLQILAVPEPGTAALAGAGALLLLRRRRAS